MESRGLGEIKVKGRNGKVVKAWKQKVVKMVYNTSGVLQIGLCGVNFGIDIMVIIWE